MSDRPEILVRDAVCDDWQSIVEFNRRLAVETEHKLLGSFRIHHIFLGCPASEDSSS